MTISKKLLSILIFPLIFMLIFGFAFLFGTSKAFADDVVHIVNYSTIANLDLAGSGGAITQPKSNDWPTEERSKENSNVVSGIISTSTAEISSRDESYQLSKHGVTDVGEPSFELDGKSNANGYVYMINNTSTSSPAAFGMRSRDITLNPNGFYRITVWYKAVNGAFGTVFVSNSKNEKETTLLQVTNLTNTIVNDAVNHNNSQGWSRVEYFIATNELETYSINIGIWLGHPTNSISLSTGVIFFDSVIVQQITQVRFENDSKFDFYLNNQDKRVLTGTAQDLRRHFSYVKKADETHIIEDGNDEITFSRAKSNVVAGTTEIEINTEKATQAADGTWSSPAAFTVAEANDEITVTLDDIAIGDVDVMLSYQHVPAMIDMPQVYNWEEQKGTTNIAHKGAWQLSSPLPVMQTPIAPGNHKAQSGNNLGEAFVAATAGSGKIELFSPESNNFLVQRYGAYEISFWAKTGTNVSATFTARTVRYYNDGSNPDNPEDQVSQGEPERSAQIDIKSETSAPTNNWTKHVLVFTGHNLFDASVRLELAFSRSKNQTDGNTGDEGFVVDAGYILIHDLQVVKLDTDNYAKARNIQDVKSTNMNFVIATLNPAAPTSLAIKNSAFNLATGAGFADDFLRPASPVTGVQDWSTPQLDVSQVLDATMSGIVSLPNNNKDQPVPTPSHWSGSNFPLNVLRIDNGIALAHNSFVSSSFDFTQGYFHRVSLRANRPSQGGYSGNAYVSIMNGSQVVAQQEIAPSNTFDSIEFLVDARTRGMSGLTIALSVGRAGGGTNRANGKAYFARVTLEQEIEITRAQFDASSANKIDLNRSGILCGEILAPAGNGLNFYKPLDYVVNNISTADEGETAFFAVAQTPVGDSIVNSLIYDTQGVPVHSQIFFNENNTKFTLAADSYYEVIIRASIKDFRLDDDADFESLFTTEMTNDEKWLIENHYGITFALDGFEDTEQQHAYIKTTNLDAVDFVWHFSTTEQRTISPIVTIGSEHAKIAVALTLFDFSVKPLTETQWKNREKFSSSSLLTAIEITNTNAVDIEEPEEKGDTEKKPFDWNLFFISLSSALLVIGIILVVFVFFGKKIRAKIQEKNRGRQKKEHQKFKAFFGKLKFWEKKA